MTTTPALTIAAQMITATNAVAMKSTMVVVLLFVMDIKKPDTGSGLGSYKMESLS